MLRHLVHDLRVLQEQDADAPVGTVRVRGASRVQKQRDGSWLAVGKARPDQIKPKKVSPSKLELPASHKRSPALPVVDIPTNRKWQDVSPEMPTSTIEIMFKDDKPRPQRRALHERILRTFLDHVDAVKPDLIPVAIVLMGGPASGRTAIVKNLTHDALCVRVDPGAIATMIPEFTDGVKKNARNAPAIVQTEAAFIAHLVLEKAIETRKNIAVDGVGADQEQYARFLGELREKGYVTTLVLSDIDRTMALERDKDRGTKTGQWAPKEAFALAKVAAKNFHHVKEVADDNLHIDVRGAPKHIPEVLSDLSNLFEADDATKPSITIKDIRRRALDGLRKERDRMGALPVRYKKGEGIILAHYDDAHIQPLDMDADATQPSGQGPADTAPTAASAAGGPQ